MAIKWLSIYSEARLARVLKPICTSQVKEAEVTGHLAALNGAVTCLGDLTKSSPKRKSTGKDPKAKAQPGSKKPRK